MKSPGEKFWATVIQYSILLLILSSCPAIVRFMVCMTHFVIHNQCVVAALTGPRVIDVRCLGGLSRYLVLGRAGVTAFE